MKGSNGMEATDLNAPFTEAEFVSCGFLDYQLLARRTAKVLDSQPLELTHAAMGMCTEAGEFASDVKRIMFYSKVLTPEMHAHMVEELGDTLWYIALAATHMGLSLEEVAARNIAKLRVRYPDKYSDEAAEAREDKDGLTRRES